MKQKRYQLLLSFKNSINRKNDLFGLKKHAKIVMDGHEGWSEKIL